MNYLDVLRYAVGDAARGVLPFWGDVHLLRVAISLDSERIEAVFENRKTKLRYSSSWSVLELERQLELARDLAQRGTPLPVFSTAVQEHAKEALAALTEHSK